MANRKPMGIGEWYHCYNRGVDKRKIFDDTKDYERFLLSMYVANGTERVHISNLRNKKLGYVLNDRLLQKGEPLVEIGAYALMPNHQHFVLKEIREGGIALFMQKLFTSYTMYFNKKYNRTGALLAGTFKSKHVNDDRYLKRLISYVHLNPVEIFEPNWKEGHGDLLKIEAYLTHYKYSSLLDFSSAARAERKILGNTIFNLFDIETNLKQMLQEAQEYYREFIKV